MQARLPEAPGGRPLLVVAPGVVCLGPWGRTRTNAYLVRSDTSWVLVDAGWAGDAPYMLRACESVMGTGAVPTAILLTHCHPDHAGAAYELARRWACQVHMHPAELPIALGDFVAMRACAGPLDRWIVLPMMRVLGRRRRDALLERSSLAGVARAFDPGSAVPGLPEWVCVPTPGHTPGHVSYFRPEDRVLITGDALVTLRVNTCRGVVCRQQGFSGRPGTPPGTRGPRRRRSAGGHGTPVLRSGDPPQ